MDKGKGYDTNLDKYEKGYLGLWEYFKHHYPAESPLEKFEDWYQSQIKDDKTNKTTSIKNTLGK